MFLCYNEIMPIWFNLICYYLPKPCLCLIKEQLHCGPIKSENPQWAWDRPLHAVDCESIGGCDVFLLGQWAPELVNPVLLPWVGSCLATLICAGVFLGSWDLTHSRQTGLRTMNSLYPYTVIHNTWQDITKLSMWRCCYYKNKLWTSFNGVVIA